MSSLRSWKIAAPAIVAVLVVVGIAVASGGDDPESSDGDAAPSTVVAESGRAGTSPVASAAPGSSAPTSAETGLAPVPTTVDATGSVVTVPSAGGGAQSNGGSGSGSGSGSGGGRATTTTVGGAATPTTTLAPGVTTTTVAGTAATTTTTTPSPGATTTTLTPVPPLDPATTTPAGDIGFTVEADGCFVTVRVDADDAGTAAVRMSGPVIDRSYLMAIENGLAEVGIRVAVQTAGEYRFDVRVTGVSSVVQASVTEDVDCRP